MRRGAVYKLTHIDSGYYYIGSTKANLDNYWGSGKTWKRFLNDNNIPRDPAYIKKEILLSGFDSESDMRKAEREEIEKHNGDIKLLNTMKSCENNQQCSSSVHKKTCPKYIECSEDNNCKAQFHKKKCPKSNKRVIPCIKEIGCKGSQHYKDCPEYIQCTKDNNCKAKDHHYKECPKYIECTKDNDCKSHNHYKECPKFGKDIIRCTEEVGCRGSHHTLNCPENKGVFECCGNAISSNKHKPGCKYYNGSAIIITVCEECLGINERHDKSCSRFNTCQTCDKHGRKHKKDCLNNNILKILTKTKKELKNRDKNQQIEIIKREIDLSPIDIEAEEVLEFYRKEF